MHRTLYLLGGGYLAICAMVAFRPETPAGRAVDAQAHPAQAPVTFEGSGQDWYTAIKPFCNEVEVVLAQRDHPAPATLDGAGFSAACYALGGKLDSAHAVIDRRPSGERAQAAGIVFEVGHPVADAGDDKAAGPIMELVVDYWPNHYMALYHAGMSEYALGDKTRARKNLESFLVNYHENDGWTSSAREALSHLR